MHVFKDCVKIENVISEDATIILWHVSLLHIINLCVLLLLGDKVFLSWLVLYSSLPARLCRDVLSHVVTALLLPGFCTLPWAR